MRILIVSQHFYPDSFRVNDIARGLVARGHRVTVVTGLPDYATGRVPKAYRYGRLRRETVEGVQVKRVFTCARRKGVIHRALNYVSFLISATLYVRFCRQKDYDAILCYQTSPVTMAHAARAMARRIKKPFFLYCLDVWPESVKAWHVGETSLPFRLIYRYSRKLYRACGRIGATSEPFLHYLHATNGVALDKLCYLPQHAQSLELCPKPSPSPEAPVRLAFGGNIGSVQDIPCVIDAAAQLLDLPQVHFDIYGDGSELENCKRYAKERGVIENVHFYGRVSLDELRVRYQEADAFLLTLKDVGLIGRTVPGKLQEYLSGARPMFAAVNGPAADIIRQARCGTVVPASDAAALADALRDFVENPQNYSQCGENGLHYYEENFTLEKFMDSLLQEMQRMEEQ